MDDIKQGRPLKITSLTQTCEACPSQWEGELEDGREIYIRYRWGTLTVNVSKGTLSAVEGPQVYYNEIGDEYDGIINQGTMLNHIKEMFINGMRDGM